MYFCREKQKTSIFCTKHTLSMKTILVAEDNDSNYILMTYILRRSYQFLRAKNGQEAVEMVDKGGIDLVLMDIKMPVMDGLEATAIIKEKQSDRQQALKAGCTDFLPKPVSGEKCLQAIAKLIGG